MNQTFTIIGSISAFVAISIGGARAHLLEKHLPKERIPMLEVGMRYQVIHSMAILFVALSSQYLQTQLINCAGWTFLTGIVVFGVVMYGYALTGWKALLRFSPLGGVVFLMGWGLFVAAALAG